MGKLIHVVEDDEDIRFIVEYVLQDAGYDVEISGTSKEFYEQLKVKQPDLILLDVRLPDGNGIDICRALKANHLTNRIVIIIMSAHAAEKTVLEEACANGFISKPFDLDRMLSVVKNSLADFDDENEKKFH